MNLSYNDMIDTGRKASTKREKFYKEDSNVFAYYVLTMILMYQYNEFLKWCDQHNTNIFVLGERHRRLSKHYLIISKTCITVEGSQM